MKPKRSTKESFNNSTDSLWNNAMFRLGRRPPESERKHSRN